MSKKRVTGCCYDTVCLAKPDRRGATLPKKRKTSLSTATKQQPVAYAATKQLDTAATLLRPNATHPLKGTEKRLGLVPYKYLTFFYLVAFFLLILFFSTNIFFLFFLLSIICLIFSFFYFFFSFCLFILFIIFVF